jgi:hypothetical protein
LTEPVREELEDRVPIAFDTGKPRDFVVVVRCPGDGSSHELRFTGHVTYTPRLGRK